MGETKENKKTKKGKHKAKPTIGDIIFRILIMIAIFLISIVFYIFYVRNMSNQILNDVNIVKQIQTYK